MQVLTTACTPAIVTFIVVDIRFSWLRILSLEAVYQTCLDWSLFAACFDARIM